MLKKIKWNRVSLIAMTSMLVVIATALFFVEVREYAATKDATEKYYEIDGFNDVEVRLIDKHRQGDTENIAVSTYIISVDDVKLKFTHHRNKHMEESRVSSYEAYGESTESHLEEKIKELGGERDFKKLLLETHHLLKTVKK